MSSHPDMDTFIQLIEEPLQSTFRLPHLYQIKAGDTLSQIITKHYGVSTQSNEYKMALGSVLHFNPQITNINTIYAGKMLKLMPLPSLAKAGTCPAPDAFFEKKKNTMVTKHFLEPVRNDYIGRYETTLPKSTEEQNALFMLAWLQQNYDLLSVSTGAGFNMFGGIISQANRAFIEEVKTHYSLYKAGKITQNTYNTRRANSLKAFAQKVGPLEKFLFKGQTVREAIRISRLKAFPATHKIDMHLDRLNKMAKVVKHGGVILTAAGVAMGCHNIGQAATRQEKNEIFVETVGSTGMSAVSGMALGVLYFSTPVGWGTALILGTTAALLSYGTGKGSIMVYDRFFNQHDLVKMTNTDSICK